MKHAGYEHGVWNDSYFDARDVDRLGGTVTQHATNLVVVASDAGWSRPVTGRRYHRQRRRRPACPPRFSSSSHVAADGVGAAQPTVSVAQGSVASKTVSGPTSAGIQSRWRLPSIVTQHADGTCHVLCHQDGPDQSQTVTITATDSDGRHLHGHLCASRHNVAADRVGSAGDGVGPRGSLATNSGLCRMLAWTRSCFRFRRAYQQHADGTWSWSLATQDGPDQSQTVTIQPRHDGAASTTTFQLVVNMWHRPCRRRRPRWRSRKAAPRAKAVSGRCRLDGVAPGGSVGVSRSTPTGPGRGPLPQDTERTIANVTITATDSAAPTSRHLRDSRQQRGAERVGSAGDGGSVGGQRRATAASGRMLAWTRSRCPLPRA